MKPLAVTLGDVTGIGPEVALRAVAARPEGVEAVLIGDPAAAEAAAGRLGLRRVPVPVEAEARVDPALVFAGRVEAAAGRAAHAWVMEAARRAAAGEFSGLVTAPISKAAWAAAGLGTDGHTERLAEVAGGRPLMLLAGATSEGPLRVALLTNHLRLRDVPRAIAPDRLADALYSLDEGLRRDFGIEAPRIGVLAVNPHAGEGGALGHEEGDVIAPTLSEIRARGVRAEGPLPGDTAFTERSRARFDAFLAAYHDQGLAPFKALAGGAGVNVTLGLPFVRTSPDHGVAHEIAGRGAADVRSMAAALSLAVEIAGRRAGAGAPVAGRA